MPPVDASGLPLPPFSAEPELQRDAMPPNGSGTKAKARRKLVVRFPVPGPCRYYPGNEPVRIVRSSAGICWPVPMFCALASAPVSC